MGVIALQVKGSRPPVKLGSRERFAASPHQPRLQQLLWHHLVMSWSTVTHTRCRNSAASTLRSPLGLGSKSSLALHVSLLYFISVLHQEPKSGRVTGGALELDRTTCICVLLLVSTSMINIGESGSRNHLGISFARL